jgi:hypothetical protein
MKSKLSIEELARIVADLQVRVRALEIGQQQSRHDNPDKSYWQNPNGIGHSHSITSIGAVDAYGDTHQPFSITCSPRLKDLDQIK